MVNRHENSNFWNQKPAENIKKRKRSRKVYQKPAENIKKRKRS